MMTDLQADRASDRRIAERLGNQVLCVGKTNEYAIMKGYERFPLPHYTTSLDAAFSLLTDPNYELSLTIIGKSVEATLSFYYSPDAGKYTAEGLSIPEAICRAWWAWMDSREHLNEI
jgi:hypothetical protein